MSVIKQKQIGYDRQLQLAECGIEDEMSTWWFIRWDGEKKQAGRAGTITCPCSCGVRREIAIGKSRSSLVLPGIISEVANNMFRGHGQGCSGGGAEARQNHCALPDRESQVEVRPARDRESGESEESGK